MKILLTAINAKFIHSSLAIRSIAAYCSDLEKHIDKVEYTINHSEDFILTDIFSQKPDIICFSCYIWNINLIVSLSKNLKKIMPNVFIVCGGPEVSYESEDFLKENQEIDMIIRGEGEKTFKVVAEALLNNKNFSNIKGITYRESNEIISAPAQEPLSMDDLPFVYEDITDLEHRIIYFETQRGCPYNCQFCLSSIEKGVRFLSLEKVFSALDFFLKSKVKQVKFVDRTFNCKKEHAESIWQYLIDNDNGITNFHMEIEAHIMEDDTLELLKKARKGLFQFEIGVQSTNKDTLSAVRRNTDFLTLREKILKIKSLGNIHIHLDLIAGLPYEGYSSFGNSFNDVYYLEPDQLQLGFLKVLKGSGLKQNSKKYGIVSRDQSPYEVLFTDDLSFDETIRLKTIEEMVEIYFNSGKALNSFKYTAKLFESPFKLFESLGDYWTKNNHHRINHSKIELYTIFFKFCLNNKNTKNNLAQIKDLLKLDMLLCDNLSNLPVWVNVYTNTEEYKTIKRNFFNNEDNIKEYIPTLINYTPSQISRMCRLERFDFNIKDNIDKHEECYILFNYYQRDFLLNQAEFFKVEV